MKCSVISGTGSYIPDTLKKNSDFLSQDFYSEAQQLIAIPKQTLIEKFEAITGIEERRYAGDQYTTSQLAAIAGKLAIADSQIDAETLDLLIVAHNFGDIPTGSHVGSMVPSLASRVKSILGIANPQCVAFDVLSGCPGWLTAVIQAEAFFKAGMAQKALIIGAETLSRVYDPFDRDSMIYSDGAGAAILEYVEGQDEGILSTHAASHCADELNYLYMGPSNNPHCCDTNLLKMKGRKVYEYALKHVPMAMKACVDKSGVPITEIRKIFIHQANEKMDEAILEAFYALYETTPPADIMPMSIHYLGNSSVATIPTLYDLVKKDHYPQHQLAAGEVILFASVGAGMNINAVCYRCR